MTTLTELAHAARVAAVQALVERERAVRLAARHTGTDAELLELYRASDAAAEVEADAWVRLLIACQRADGTWNRDRAACQQIAAEALAKEEQR